MSIDKPLKAGASEQVYGIRSHQPCYGRMGVAESEIASGSPPVDLATRAARISAKDRECQRVGWLCWPKRLLRRSRSGNAKRPGWHLWRQARRRHHAEGPCCVEAMDPGSARIVKTGRVYLKTLESRSATCYYEAGGVRGRRRRRRRLADGPSGLNVVARCERWLIDGTGGRMANESDNVPGG